MTRSTPAIAIPTGPRRVGIDAIARSFRPGEHVFLAGSSGEAVPLTAALAADPGLTRRVRLTTTFVPGINRFDAAALHPEAEMFGLFVQRPDHRAIDDSDVANQRAFHHIPVSYYGFVRLIRERYRFDTCVLQVAPPDARGRCSLGVAVEFATEVVARSRRVIGIINPLMPRVSTAPTLALDDFAMVTEADFAIPTYDTGAIDARSAAIAAHIAAFIEDRAALQVGLGKIPAAVMALLEGRRGLRLQSGMLSDGVIGLAEGGMLDPGWRHMTCVLVGSRKLYDWAADRRDIHVLGCGDTHDPVRLAGVSGLVAVNSALEVDLLGQCNLEFAGGRAVSGPGGAPNFAFAASHSKRGISIVALPATFGRAAISRIVPRLGEAALATLSRTDVDVVVTEHGAADLRGASVVARAEALIQIAAPDVRADLLVAWREMARTL